MKEIGLAVSCLAALSASTAAGLDLVREGQGTATIVIPADPTYWEKAAAAWVQEYVERATGAHLHILPESGAPKGTLISVGHTEIARAAGIHTDDLKYDGCKLLVRGNVLFLLGRDTGGVAGSGAQDAPPNPKYPQLLGARGTCRAAAKFLEDVLGVRWFVPSADGERVPATKDLAVPGNLDVSFSPAFAFSHGRYIYGLGPAGLANNFRTSIKVKSYGGHSYYAWVPAKQHFANHPEYFALINGKRTGSGNHLCTTHPEVRQLLKQGLFAAFEEGYDWVSVSQTDGYRRCQCPACEALDSYRGYILPGEVVLSPEWTRRLMAYPCERLHLTHKWLIDEAAKQYPQKKVHLIVYCPTATPSRKFDDYGDNVILEIANNANPDLVERWKGKAAGMTAYVCWYDTTESYGWDQGDTPSQVARRLRYLHDHGCVGMYWGGLGENWGFFGPSFYVIARMLGDPDLDPAQLVAEYCEGLYGAAAEPMKTFFQRLWARFEALHPALTNYPHLIGLAFDDMQITRYPPAFLAELERLLHAAEAQADGDRSKNFIRVTRDQFDYNKLLTDAFLAYRSYQAAPTAESWAQTRRAVEKFDAFRERVLRYPDGFTERWYPGYGHVCNYLTSEGTTKSYYSTWRGRREQVLAKPVRGSVIGYRRNCVRAPLTLDFTKPPPGLAH